MIRFVPNGPRSLRPALNRVGGFMVSISAARRGDLCTCTMRDILLAAALVQAFIFTSAFAQEIRKFTDLSRRAVAVSLRKRVVRLVVGYGRAELPAPGWSLR